jgi:VIT1/CCC1 family predicted Fe2+/Mn2+ transporter
LSRAATQYLAGVTGFAAILRRWRDADDRVLLLQVVQPALVGLIDGTVSTLAPIFATAYLAGSRAALLVGLATALGAGVSMGLSEGLSDDGKLTGRGTGMARGMIIGTATFLGGSLHSLPFLIGNVNRALVVAYVVVAFELGVIALIRRRFLDVSLGRSMIEVGLGGALVLGIGVALGHA